MSKYRELLHAKGYTDEDFGPQRVFLTPRAAETALAAGITQIRPLKPEIERIGHYINQHGRPEYPFPENFDETAIVLRWGGQGNRWLWQGFDTQIRTAPDKTRYLNAWNITSGILSALRLGHPPLESTTKAELPPATTVECTVSDWEDPNLAEQLAIGAMNNFYATRTPGISWGNITKDFTAAMGDAYGPSRIQRAKLAAAAANEPFDRLMPLVPLHPNDM